MLVLSRRPNQAVLVPGVELTIRVLASKDGSVRLGFEAPPWVSILREELTEKPVVASADPTGQAFPSD